MKKWIAGIVAAGLLCAGLYYAYALFIVPSSVGIVTGKTIRDDGSVELVIVDENSSQNGIYFYDIVTVDSFWANSGWPKVGQRVRAKVWGARTDIYPGRYTASHLFVHPEFKPRGANHTRSGAIRAVLQAADLAGVAVVDVSFSRSEDTWTMELHQMWDGRLLASAELNDRTGEAAITWARP